MAETSGFFQAQWDESLLNPITQEYSGWWDRSYDSEEFRKYFGQFIKNGVFGTPTNQLKVIAGTGLNVIVSEGWAMINGAYYHNDAPKTLTVRANTGSGYRYDSVMLRYSEEDRQITAVCLDNVSNPTRNDNIYDLKLATITLAPGTSSISDSNITDTRTNETVCGMVTGVLEVETTEDLFLQFEAQFNEWFNDIKGQLDGDLGVRLQLEFQELNETTTEALEEANELVEEYTTRDFVIPQRRLYFTNNVCQIDDERITSDSLIDVYFTQGCIDEAVRCGMYVESFTGYLRVTAQRTPEMNINATIGVRVR